MKTTNAAKPRPPAAFTLTELLVTVAVITVLSSLLGVSSTQTKTKTRQAQCLSNLHQIALGMMNYATAHQGRLPTEKVLPSGDPFDCWLALDDSLASPSVVHCPADRRFSPAARFDELTEADVSYTISVQARADEPGMLLSTDGFLSDARFLADALGDAHWETQINPSHGADRGNALFVDGSAQALSTHGVRAALAESLRVANLQYLECLLPGDRPLGQE